MAEVDEQVDRISNLPDALLSEILSFLSTKEAVATSILSKRWESIWTKVPVLNFSVYSVSVNSFEAFVDRVLICNDSHSLRLFKLSVFSFGEEIINEVKYHSWITHIMRRDIVEIDLDLEGGTLPSGTFSNEKLMVLKMSGFYSPLLNPIHLPNLLTLHFTSIDFTDEFSLNDIMVRLPRLEELVISECIISQNICIRSSSIRRLHLIRKFCLTRRKEKYTIVAAPSLEYLCIDGFSPHYEFCNMPSVAEARLHIPHSKDYDYYLKALKLLKQVSNLMILELQVATMEATIGDTEHDQQPLFPHLTRLTVIGYDFRSAKCSKFSWRHLVLWILKRAPNLVSLDYSSIYYKWLEDEELQRLPVLPSSLPKCPMPTLEAVNISLFDFSDDDKIFLEYLLNNAKNMKVLKINLEGMVSGTTIAAIASLFKVPRASSICKLVISHQK